MSVTHLLSYCVCDSVCVCVTVRLSDSVSVSHSTRRECQSVTGWVCAAATASATLGLKAQLSQLNCQAQAKASTFNLKVELKI